MSPEAPQMVANKNVEQIAKLESQQVGARTLSERIAGAVTRAAGTATFAIGHLVWFAGWILLNAGIGRRLRPFDPFPFNLLTMIVSLEAIFLSIWILISQNQMSRQADRREHLGLQLTLLAEQESTATLRLVRQIAERLGVSVVDSDQGLAAETNLDQLVATMDEALPGSPGNASPTAPGIPARMTATHHPPEDTT
jgi:uncharacterized membrane protein